MNKQSALLQMHFAAVLFGISGILGQLIESNSLIISAGRSIFAIFAMTLLCFKFGYIPWRTNLKTFYGLFVSGLLLAAHWTCFFLAIKVGNVAMATLGFACFPAFTALFESLFFKEPITKIEYILLACVSIGLIMVTPSFEFSNTATLGLLWGILSGIIYAGVVIINRYNLAYTSGVQMCWWQCIIVLVVMLPFTATTFASVSLMDWLWIACLGLFCTGLAYYLFINSLTVLKARTASIIIALEPIYAILGAWMLFSEQPTLRTLVGGSIILAAVIWTGLQKQPS